MLTLKKDEIDALVTADVITLTRRPDDELSMRPQSEHLIKLDSDDRRTQKGDTEELMNDTAGLLALEMMDRQNTEKEYNELFNSANNLQH